MQRDAVECADQNFMRWVDDLSTESFGIFQQSILAEDLPTVNLPTVNLLTEKLIEAHMRCYDVPGGVWTPTDRPVGNLTTELSNRLAMELCESIF